MNLYAEKVLFDALVLDRGTVRSFKLAYVPLGLQEYKDKIQDRSIAYYYKDVAPDKANNFCGIWYQNLVVKKEMGIEDPNCCYTFKKYPNIFVTVCDTKKFRCIKETRVQIKKFYLDCMNHFSKNKPDFNPKTILPSEKEAATPLQFPDSWDLENGNYEGWLWHFTLL